MSNKTSKRWLLALMLAGGAVALQAQQLAFPGAQGWDVTPPVDVPEVCIT